MRNPNTGSYPKALKEMMSQKSEILSKAHALSDIGIPETARSLWSSAAGYEESIATHLDILGWELEGAIHRVSAASCYEKAGYLIRAVSLYRAALSGPLGNDTRQDVKNMLSACFVKLTLPPAKNTESS